VEVEGGERNVMMMQDEVNRRGEKRVSKPGTVNDGTRVGQEKKQQRQSKQKKQIRWGARRKEKPERIEEKGRNECDRINDYGE